MAYSKQTWDTTSYVNPTRMNHIEDGIANVLDGSQIDIFLNNDITFSDTETDIFSVTRNLKKGTYLIFGSVNASWYVDSFQTSLYLTVGTNKQSAFSSAKSQTNTPCSFNKTFSISSDGNYTIKLSGETAVYSKEVTIHAFQNIGLNIIRISDY